jgi:CRISPR-associated protein Csd2
MSNNNIHTDPARRHDFVLVFEVESGNPNGDPDAGNLPRVDPETGHGIVTDVCLKRKVRDYLQMTKGIPIFIQSETALNRLISDTAKELNIDLSICTIEDEKVIEWFQTNTPENFELDGNELTYSGDLKDIKKTFAAIDDKEMKKKLDAIAKQLSGKKTLSSEDRARTQRRMIEKYFDIKMFGAVLSTGINAGQVRGPVQLTFAKSVDPIFRNDVPITRKAVTKEEDKKRKETEMARKPIVPYALYLAHGFYNPYFALEKKDKPDDPDSFTVSKDNLANLWEALEWMFNNDTAAARGRMATRGLYVFSHDSKRGNEHSHKLFDRIKIRLDDEKRQKDEPVERFCDYKIDIIETGLEEKNVTLKKLVDDRKDCQ